jgi:hypothetical protein
MPYHPWINDQAERMNRTVKEATDKTFHYDALESFKAHVLSFATACNFAKHHKALKWKIPFQSICDAWKSNPSAFKINPRHLTQRPHTWSGNAARVSITRIRDCKLTNVVDYHGKA